MVLEYAFVSVRLRVLVINEWVKPLLYERSIGTHPMHHDHLILREQSM